MKNLTKRLPLVLFLAVIVSTSSFAQPGRGMGPCGGANYNQAPAGKMQCRIPDLTEEQQTQIEALRLEHMKAVQPLQNQLNEYRAKYRTLMSAETIDTKAVDKLIDDKTAVMNKLMKLNASHRSAVRALLTDEQKVYFDSRGPGQGKGMAQRGQRGQGNGQGYGRGNAQCPRWN